MNKTDVLYIGMDTAKPRTNDTSNVRRISMRPLQEWIAQGVYANTEPYIEPISKTDSNTITLSPDKYEVVEDRLQIADITPDARRG